MPRVEPSPEGVASLPCPTSRRSSHTSDTLRSLLALSVSTRLAPFSREGLRQTRFWNLFLSTIAAEFASNNTAMITTMPAAAESWKIFCGRLIQS